MGRAHTLPELSSNIATSGWYVALVHTPPLGSQLPGGSPLTSYLGPYPRTERVCVEGVYNLGTVTAMRCIAGGALLVACLSFHIMESRGSGVAAVWYLLL